MVEVKYIKQSIVTLCHMSNRFVRLKVSTFLLYFIDSQIVCDKVDHMFRPELCESLWICAYSGTQANNIEVVMIECEKVLTPLLFL